MKLFQKTSQFDSVSLSSLFQLSVGYVFHVWLNPLLAFWIAFSVFDTDIFLLLFFVSNWTPHLSHGLIVELCLRYQSGVRQAVFFLTDGRSQEPVDDAAKDLHTLDPAIYAIGVSRKVDEYELEARILNINKKAFSTSVSTTFQCHSQKNGLWLPFKVYGALMTWKQDCSYQSEALIFPTSF